MINFDHVTGENTIVHNQNWPHIPNHPYRILIIRGNKSGKTNAVINTIHHQEKGNDIDKIFLYATDLHKAKY